MRTLAVIPARLGATRLPRKPLRLLANLPLVVRVWQRVAAMSVAEHCVVATDSEEVAQAVRAHGGHAVLTSSDHPSGTDRVAEVARRVEFASFDAVVNVQGDEPFVSTQAVERAAALVTAGRFPLATAAVRATAAILDDPNVVKVVAADDQRAMYFSRAPIPFLRDASDAAVQSERIWQHLGIYAYTRAALEHWVALPVHPLEHIERLEQLRPLAAGVPIGVAVIDEPVRVGIDTEEDLERANRDWTHFSTG
ncbi:MAG TPA: 3-deoxy-manno-octulosonate cytidylyltransferase [Gemmatimonadaceae bacterium]